MEWLYYIGTVVLKMSEEEFRRCTPKKFFGLMKQHQKFLNPVNEYKNKPADNTQQNIREIKGKKITLKKIQE